MILSCLAIILETFINISKDMLELPGLKEIYAPIQLKLIDVLQKILKDAFYMLRRGIKMLVNFTEVCGEIMSDTIQ